MCRQAYAARGRAYRRRARVDPLACSSVRNGDRGRDRGGIRLIAGLLDRRAIGRPGRPLRRNRPRPA